MAAKSANGVRGHLISDMIGSYHFRVYDEHHNFVDYALHHSDLVVRIADTDAFFYQDSDGACLDHGPATLGISDEITDEFPHEKLIRHLKGIRQVVVNNCHGGFSISRDAELLYLERARIEYVLQDRDSRNDTERWGQAIMINDQEWNSRMLPRDDVVLVSVLQELGKLAWGDHAELKIVEIPAAVEWEINEYDGREWVAQAHQRWY